MIKKLRNLSVLVLSIVILTSCSSNDDSTESLSLATLAITLITDNSAQSGGEIINEGSSEILSKGVCWSVNQNPTTNDFNTSEGSNSNSFTSNLVDLEPDTTYYLRSYAINSAGVAYGNEIEFTTDDIVASAPCTLTDNTIIRQGGIELMFTTTQAGNGTPYSFFGDYGVRGTTSGSQGEMIVDFKNAPETGVYTIVSSFSVNPNLNECIISMNLNEGGGINSWCTSAPSFGEDVFVNKLDEDRYSITFCNMEFGCVVGGVTSYNFITDGNLIN